MYTPHTPPPLGVLDICRGLTKLDLSYCEIPTAHSLLNLSALVDLRQMRLGCLHGNATLPGSVFSSMTHMHSMNLARIAVEDVHFVSCLSRLHFMDLCNVNGPPASAQAGAYREPLRLLPSIGGGGIGGGGGGGGFAFPASLREYRQFGECIVLDGSVLAPCTQLTKLVLRRTSLAGVESGGASLLSALAGMQELDTLCCADLSRVNWPAPGSVYTALTRSPKLRVLTLSDCAVPLGAWKHALPAAGLPSLRHLISTADGGYSVSHYWEAEHVSRLASCCPGIESLRLWVRSSPPCAELPAFTALTELDLTVNCQRDEPAAVGVCVEHVAGIFELSWLDLRFLLPGNDDARARYDPETETADDAVWAAAMLPLAEAWGLSFCRVRLQRPWQPLNYARVFLKAGEQYDDFPDSSDEAEFGSDDDGDEVGALWCGAWEGRCLLRCGGCVGVDRAGECLGEEQQPVGEQLREACPCGNKVQVLVAPTHLPRHVLPRLLMCCAG